MGRFVLICRLAVRDLRHRPAQAILLLIAITAATTTLTLGLALQGVTSQPYQQTRTATKGPDVVAHVGRSGISVPASDLSSLDGLAGAPGVASHSGPYPFTYVTLQANGHTAGARVEGRDEAAASVDQPALTVGTWVKPGQIVLERSFAEELGAAAGDQITLNGRQFQVAGVAVTAATNLLYPHICYSSCHLTTAQLAGKVPGVAWATQADARSLASTAEPLGYLLNLKLTNPDAADSFVNHYNHSHSSQTAPILQSWQSLSASASNLVRNEQQVLQVASWLLGLLAVAGVIVLVGGRMADQTRRVGLLKAVGGSPAFVTALLLSEHLLVAVVAAAAGLLAGWQLAPLLTNPGAALLGTAGPPAMNATTIGLVVVVALAIAAVATLVPAMRAAQISTVAALEDAAHRPPHRSERLIELSALLPVPLLLGLRLAARRPIRTLLNVASITVTTSGIVAVLCVHSRFGQVLNYPGLTNPQTGKLNRVLLILTVALIALAAVNAILITWATVLDNRHTSALTLALGATTEQVGVGLATAQALPSLAGALLGIPGGIGLFAAVSTDGTIVPPVWWLVATVIGTLAAVVVITMIPSWLGTRRATDGLLQAETA